MDPNSASSFLAFLFTLSVATERLVEIIKGLLPSKWLSVKHEDDAKERRRKTLLQILAVGAGIITAWLSSSFYSADLVKPYSSFNVVVLGLLASGGSGFWNSLATYVLDVKDIQKQSLSKATDESS
jgi:hypothetical protein